MQSMAFFARPEIRVPRVGFVPSLCPLGLQHLGGIVAPSAMPSHDSCPRSVSPYSRQRVQQLYGLRSTQTRPQIVFHASSRIPDISYGADCTPIAMRILTAPRIVFLARRSKSILIALFYRAEPSGIRVKMARSIEVEEERSYRKNTSTFLARAHSEFPFSTHWSFSPFSRRELIVEGSWRGFSGRATRSTRWVLLFCDCWSQALAVGIGTSPPTGLCCWSLNTFLSYNPSTEGCR